MNEPRVLIEDIVNSAVENHRGKIGPLLPVLHDVQASIGHVPAAAVPLIGEALSLSRAEVHGVLGFYHDFRSEPAGEHVIQLCRAEACQATGSRELEKHLRDRLGINCGETTPDGRFTLEAVYCLGNCACGPSLRVNEEGFARVSPAVADSLLDDLEAES